MGQIYFRDLGSIVEVNKGAANLSRSCGAARASLSICQGWT